MSTLSDPLEHALASADARLDDVLDLVDEAVERAAAENDRETLERIAQRLDAAASDRGDEWRNLRVAAARARALAGVAAPPPTAPADDEPPAVAAEPQLVYAGWWSRAFALVLDLVVLGFADVIVPLDLVSLDSPGWGWFVVPLAYFAGIPALADGVTPGKAVFGIAIRIDDGSPIGFGRALGRTVSLFVLWVTVIGAFVDVIQAGLDSRGQSIHDKLAATIVVRTRT